MRRERSAGDQGAARGRVVRWMIFLSCVAAPLHAQSIFTVAGVGRDDGRPATFATLNYPIGVDVGPDGDLFIVEQDANRVRRVDAETGIITTIAGNGADDFSGDGGPARAASLSRPSGVAVDAQGNVFVIDTWNYRIRRIDALTGIITTAAGGDLGDPSPSDGARARDVFLGTPRGIAIDTSGNLVFSARDRVWRATGSNGTLKAIAGNGDFGFSGDGGPATQAAFKIPTNLHADAYGNIFIVDSNNSRVRRVTSSGIITTIAGGGSSYGDDIPATAALVYPVDVQVDSSGRVVFSDTSNSLVRVVDLATGLIDTIAGKPGFPPLGDGGPATAANLVTPAGIAFGTDGDLYVATNMVGYDPDFHPFNANRVRRVESSTGIIETVVGRDGEPSNDGGPAINARLLAPVSLAMDGSRNLFIAEQDRNVVRRIDGATGVITTFAGTGERGYNGERIPATEAKLERPTGVAVDDQDRVYIAEYDRVRRVGTDGLIETFAGTGASGFSGDGGPATSARVNNLRGIATDSSGRLFLADTYNHRIRRVDLASGIIETVAGNGLSGFTGDGGQATQARLDNPWDVAVDEAGNIFIADGSHTIRRVDVATGTIRTIGGTGRNGFSGDGGVATRAMLGSPDGVAVDSDGTVYIADSFNDRVRRIVGGIMSTYAGAGSGGVAGDAGPASRAALGWPVDVLVDSEGDLYVAQADPYFGTSAVRFVPKCRVIEPPSLTSPASGSTGVLTSPVLVWGAVKGAFRYDVYLDTVSPPRKVAASDVGTNSFSPSNLEPLRTYYWKVVAKGDPYCTPYRTTESEVRSFTTASVCAAPRQ